MVVGEVNSGEGDAEAQLPLVPKGSSSISMTCLCLTHSITQTHNHNHNLPHATTTFSSSLHNRNPLFQLFSVSNQFPLLSRALFQSIILRPRIRPFSTNLTASYSSSAFAQIMANFDADSVTYLTQRDAAEIDETLMGPLGFSVDQLMELDVLSVATSISEVYKPCEHSRVLTICGPGNNGGDGLVAARHLHHFGYKPFVCYPKRTPKPLYAGLVTQLEALSIPFLSVEELPSDLSNDFDVVIDAMFGFSFHGSPRPPFDDLIQRLVSLHNNNNQIGQKRSVIVSVDIPSGWHVEEGDVDGAKKFCGPHHFLGGRFVPPAIAEKYKLILPPYPGTSMCVRIGKPPQIDISALRENYISPEFLEEQVEVDPINQFHKWFDDALAAGLKEPNAMALSTVGKDGKPTAEAMLFGKCLFVFACYYCFALVRVEGPVQKVSDEESEQYFHSRPRGSQIGAIVSKQVYFCLTSNQIVMYGNDMSHEMVNNSTSPLDLDLEIWYFSTISSIAFFFPLFLLCCNSGS
ncbi:Pyridoxine/pyridoxamine 5'-phosphate oxidase 1, chloroplastic [Glycine soja]|uniref:NAD(P)H-hydrate epimerase n=1 Tax=Glycine soja TaxID=3848 RepID=A0A445K786_GLYSO|nr:Pyridoxine/pyridoxamine 5'-phosphate oxidase 1, chloroplastic [Glycine soja]